MNFSSHSQSQNDKKISSECPLVGRRVPPLWIWSPTTSLTFVFPVQEIIRITSVNLSSSLEHKLGCFAKGHYYCDLYHLVSILQHLLLSVSWAPC